MSSDDLNLPLERKRRLYKCEDGFVELSSIPSWKELSTSNDPRRVEKLYPANDDINNRVSLFHGDITTLEIDCIVNSASRRLVGSVDSKTVDGSIHRAAGVDLREECNNLNGCPVGLAKITNGYCLPARFVIHTVGPLGKKPDLLQSCYKQCYKVLKEKGLRTIAFPCISTGKLGYPSEDAAHVALASAREFLELDNNANEVDRIIFCLFLSSDINIYERLMHRYFPRE